jgi:hypothetical protein
MENINNMEIPSFYCPVGQCGKLIQRSISAVTAHIRDTHPGVHKNLGYPKTIGFCTECTSYTRSRHFHCRECSEIGSPLYFKSEIELTTHLKDAHTKWYFEFECKYSDKCHGKSGACGFNHLTPGRKHITNYEPIPDGTCRYDRPWDGVRCRKTHCSFDHFRGRVKFLIELKAAAVSASAVSASAASAAAPAEAPEAEYEEDFEEDFEEEDERREADKKYEKECHEQQRNVLRGSEGE